MTWRKLCRRQRHPLSASAPKPAAFSLRRPSRDEASAMFCSNGLEEKMRSLLAMILAMMVGLPAAAPAQQEQTALRRVHLMTGAGTIPRNPAYRLEYLRYAT